MDKTEVKTLETAVELKSKFDLDKPRSSYLKYKVLNGIVYDLKEVKE